MKNPVEALRAIEVLVGNDFGMDMECFLYDIPKGKKYHKTTLKKDLKQAAKIITEIYTIAHAENSRCGHSAWEQKKYKILKEQKYY